MSKHQLLFLVVSLFCALVSADYTIDDSNYSVLKFSENPAGPVWGPFGSDTGEVLEIRLPNGTMQTVDATQCYDGTYTYAACAAKDNCAMQFSFTGSGITIYVLRAGPQGMSASLSIDSGSATTATLDVPPAPQYYIPHAVLFSVQNIPSGTHSAVMTVQDWNGGFSGMMLDYIDVNQAQVSGPTSSTPSPSPTPSSTPAQSPTSTPASSNAQTTSQLTSSTGTRTSSVSLVSSALVSSAIVFSSQSSGTAALPSSTSSGNGTGTTVSTSPTSKKTNLAAVVGGVIGGVGLLALLGLAFFCFRRRRRQHMETLSLLHPPQAEGRFMDAGTISADPFSGTTSTDPFASAAVLSSSRPSGSSRPLLPWTESETGSTLNLANNPSSTTNVSHMRSASSGSNGATSSTPLLLGVATATAVAATTSAAVPQDHGPSAPTPPGQPAVRPGGGDGYPGEKAGPAPQGDAEQDPAAHSDVPGTRPNEVLTDDQADFVNSLFNNNVPAPVVARVLERMLANPQGANTTGYNDPELRPHLNSANLSTSTQGRASSGGMAWHAMMNDFGDGETTIGSAPPSYDFVQAQ